MKRLSTLSVVSLIAAFGTSCGWSVDDDRDGEIGVFGLGDEDDENEKFSAILEGGNERPIAVTTTGSGLARFETDRDEDRVGFTLTASGLEDVVGAHLHLAGREEAGPVVAVLLDPDAPAAGEGRLAAGSLSDIDLVGPLGGASLEDLLVHMRAGVVYVNVHTTRYPDGEIRGQVDPD